jgi:hypothetical protein
VRGSFFELARLAGPRRSRRKSEVSLRRDTCFVNIVGPHRTPMAQIRIAGGIHQQSWERSPEFPTSQTEPRVTPGQGHDRIKCTLHEAAQADVPAVADRKGELVQVVVRVARRPPPDLGGGGPGVQGQPREDPSDRVEYPLEAPASFSVAEAGPAHRAGRTAWRLIRPEFRFRSLAHGSSRRYSMGRKQPNGIAGPRRPAQPRRALRRVLQ